jgi:type II secretory pathway component PulC
MSFADLFEQRAPLTVWIAVVITALCAAAVVHRAVRLPAVTDARPVGAEVPASAWPAGAPDVSGPWDVFQGAPVAPTAPGAGGAMARRYRLAGTFFSYGEHVSDERRAILDDLSSGRQHIVGEQSQLDDVTVVRIFRDRVVLQAGDRREELWLSFVRRPSTAATGTAAGVGAAEEGAGAGGEPPNRFGISRVGENRWVFDRASMLAYYQELMDEPVRLAQVFDSLKPLYDEQRRITGYQLGMEGEEAFFEAAGWREGDIVRSVNSIPMTNRRRAEYFIKEFVADRANAFVIEVERDGDASKLIYQLR